MTFSPCLRCGEYWARNSGPDHHFTVITRFCPTCVLRLPIAGDAR